MKKYIAFGLTLSGVHSAWEKLFGLAKPEAEKFVTSVASAGEPLAGRRTFRSLFPIFVASGTLSPE